MKRLFFSTLIALLLSAISIQAQSDQLRTLAEQLQRNTSDLAERTYNDFTRGISNNRSDVETLLNAQQLGAGANLFKRMVDDRRQDSELRDVISSLNDVARRAPSNSFNNNYWRDVQKTLDDISREIGSGGFNNDNRGNNDNRRNNRGGIIGNVTWRGTVDDEVQLVIRQNTIEVKTISGQTYNNGTYDFTSPLPNRSVQVEVEKNKGRGSVKILQQPNRANDFTTIIQIRDKDGGPRDYEIEVYWR